MKQLADKRHIAILLIHHLRKLHDDDPMNMISGSTGLSGAADSTFVLQKNSRLANIASLHCTGRDIPDRTLKLEFGEEDHVWKLLEDSKTCSGASRISTLRIENLLSELLQKESEISAPLQKRSWKRSTLLEARDMELVPTKEPASHLASRRCPGSPPNAPNRAEARTHYFVTKSAARVTPCRRGHSTLRSLAPQFQTKPASLGFYLVEGNERYGGKYAKK